MRFLNMVYAKAFGYFWTPCPVCGKYFGGHEVKGKFMEGLIISSDVSSVTAKIVCSEACSKKAHAINIRHRFAKGQAANRFLKQGEQIQP